MKLHEIKLLEFSLEKAELTAEQQAELARVQKNLPIRTYLPTDEDVENAEIIEL